MKYSFDNLFISQYGDSNSSLVIYTSGNSLEECLANAELSIVGQNGGEKTLDGTLDDWGYYDEAKQCLEICIKRIDYE